MYDAIRNVSSSASVFQYLASRSHELAATTSPETARIASSTLNGRLSRVVRDMRVSMCGSYSVNQLSVANPTAASKPFSA